MLLILLNKLQKLQNKGNLLKAQAYSMNQKRLISQIVHSEEQKELFNSWKKTMSPLYKQINNQVEKDKMALQKQFESEKDLYSNKNLDFINITKTPDRLQLS